MMTTMLAALAATSMTAQQAEDSLLTHDLQEVQVVSTRATKKTPMAFSNVTQEEIRRVNHGKDVPQMMQMLPSVTTS